MQRFLCVDTSCDGRVVKALDSKSNGMFPRRFESCSQRSVDDLSGCWFVWRHYTCAYSFVRECMLKTEEQRREQKQIVQTAFVHCRPVIRVWKTFYFVTLGTTWLVKITRLGRPNRYTIDATLKCCKTCFQFKRLYTRTCKRLYTRLWAHFIITYFWTVLKPQVKVSHDMISRTLALYATFGSRQV